MKKDLFVVVLNKFDVNEVSIWSFKKHAFVDRLFTLRTVQKKFTNNKLCRYYRRGLRL